MQSLDDFEFKIETHMPLSLLVFCTLEQIPPLCVDEIVSIRVILLIDVFRGQVVNFISLIPAIYMRIPTCFGV